ncbi:hypothetical protein [Candidatus Nitrosocosmicus arcticus]|uniref:Uncharacterized protein n=1 Tax=Candidatus Nitrosocosmicus arcticus TaxID=2035267 RepID=A0A557SW08_9ARCH|nr:hypothetical protein [Candidatus Nitrosocosmicus arcticus]TVP40797.1 hypothetical protein NARC_60184 [Candidatus Nitrosocosmicus arcticus]
MTTSTENINEIVTNLENKLGRKFSTKRRKIMEFIASENYKGRGITVKQLRISFKYTRDYAEKIIQDLKSRKVLTPTSIRKGHLKSYFLTNMQDYIPLVDDFKNSSTGSSTKQVEEREDIFVMLFKELSNNKGLFHNFRLQTNLVDIEDYNRLSLIGECKWEIKSASNKAKVREIRLSTFRTARLQVSPNGTVEIYISSSRDPYDLHYDTGLSEFMVDLGKIEGMFQSELNLSQPLDHFYEWNLIRLDYNYDIVGLNLAYGTNRNGVLQVKHLSGLYQFYIKQLPEKGLVLRLEKHFSFYKPFPTVKEFESNLCSFNPKLSI